jgi:hypothetical protein
VGRAVVGLLHKRELATRALGSNGATNLRKAPRGRAAPHHLALAATHANRATKVAANSSGTASASGRPIDSPSVLPGRAKAATVRAYSGTARRIWA